MYARTGTPTSASSSPLRATAALALLLAGCTGAPKDDSPADSDSDRDTGSDSGTDSGTDSDSPTDTDADTGEEPPPAPGEPWQRDERQAPGSITFSELLYHPASDGPDAEWIELYNPMALDMDVSGWSLDGGVRYTFAEGTTIAAGGYLVVAADPSGLPDAVGPYEGRLDDDGERIELFNNTGRLIDTVGFGDDEPWSVLPDGSGLSLAKIDPDAASDRAESWTGSAELGGTPGRSNLLDPDQPPTVVELVPLDATWSFDVSGDYVADDWATPGYDDGDWERGQAIFFAGQAQEEALATVRVTADNYYALYLGRADGGDLRLVAEDADGDWTTVESFEVWAGPEDHLYLVAWEAPGDSYSPQMTIAEVDLGAEIVGTDATRFEWVLGSTDANPGTTPPDPPPSEEEILLLVEATEDAAAWDLPGVEAPASSDPWGWATSGSFDGDTQFIWADTFDSNSITNIENTYALFRSRDPVLGARGTTELSTIPTTATFRTTFSFDGDPGAATLTLECLLDDGAIVSLNGVEVLRENMPSGPVDAATLASATVGDATALYAELPADALVSGENVLAVELHQAEPDDADLTFGCALTARISAESSSPPVLLNEVAPAGEAPMWVELYGVRAQDTDGLVLVSSSGAERVLSAGSIEPGEHLEIDDLGFAVTAGEVLFLYSADRTSLFDAVRVSDRLRGRDDDGGPWRFPSEATPGAPNLVARVDDIVIHEIQYHRAPVSREGEPVTDRPEEWIELYNRGTEPVDLGGWQLVDAVAYEIPAGTILAPDGYLVIANAAALLRADHPHALVVGDFEGRLDNAGERILLLDAQGNPADEVRYFDGGRWPSAADGGGSSLELRDPRADNSAAEAWSASDEAPRSEWTTYSYRGLAEGSAVGPDGTWEELVVGLLDEGEILLDDIRVVREPDGAAVGILQNETFDAGSASWRLLGNHRHSEVVPDPDDPSNPVLRLRATGPTGHMHNHAETTLREPMRVREYEVSFRARWISGTNQLNTRLYFNRLPRTTLVAQPELSGTPGAPNSTAEDNLGPTFADLRQDVAVPAPHQPVAVTVSVADPDGVAAVTLWSSADGAPFEGAEMIEGAPGEWLATLEGRDAGTIVQMYVEAEDTLGARATFPAAGPDSRALLRFDDGEAETNGLHNFRILLTQADSDWMHEDINLMSDDLVGATVVYDESKVFYDVGVRAKGSERGRPEVARLGYGVRFRSDQPFRGSHTSVLVDRSEGVGYGQREVLLNLVMTRAGSVSGEYNDLIHALTPLPEHTGPAELQLDRFSNLVLASQFEDGDEGALFEYEYIYFPLTTDDGTPEGYKLPQPDSVTGNEVTFLGEDKEAYRWTFLLQNNEREDDYTDLIELGRTFALSGAAFRAQADLVIDVDQWLRGFAFATLSGAIDNYGSDDSGHNARFYVRPEDGRMLYFPHDLDFFGGTTMPVVGNGDLARLLEEPTYRRLYYGHLQDIVARAYNEAYLAPWCAQMGALLPAQDIAGHCRFIGDRAEWVMTGASDAVLTVYPTVDFRITTNGGADVSVEAAEVTLEGEGWIDVRAIGLDGATEPLELTWVDDHTWRVVVPLVEGPNDLVLVATNHHGDVVGSDSIVVTATSGG